MREWVVENDPVYGSFRRPGRTEKVAASVTLLLIHAVAILLLLFDWNWLREPIGRWASAKYDREIALQGDLDVTLFSWTPSVIVRDLKFGGPEWAREADTANVERIEAKFRLRKLFTGQIEMPLLAVTRPKVVLISTKDGRQSWDLEPNNPDTGEGLKLPLINQLVIEDGLISLDAQDRDITLEAAITAREAASAADGDTGFRLTGAGSINGSPLALRIESGPFINIRRDRPYRFEATLAGARSRLVADGSITRPVTQFDPLRRRRLRGHKRCSLGKDLRGRYRRGAGAGIGLDQSRCRDAGPEDRRRIEEAASPAPLGPHPCARSSVGAERRRGHERCRRPGRADRLAGRRGRADRGAFRLRRARSGCGSLIANAR